MAEAKAVRQFEDEEVEREELSVDPEDSMVAQRGPRAPQLRKLGRYRLVREIASGGMASVNLAVTDGLDKLVALKMIHPHLAQEQPFVRMFLDEARIASSISHRNVCNTFDFGEAEGRYYIAMDYLAGQSLRDLILRLRKNPAEAEPKRLAAYMAYILAEACEGLHAAHELRDAQGSSLEVVHRDVSPHNLFVTYDGNVSVVDFGIARASDRLQHTATGVLKGKFSYMAPEQVRQLDVDRRADIWSLGVCLWEAVTLERLFVRSSQADTLMSVMMDRVRPPSEVRPELSKAIDNVTQRALSRSPQQRYATAREMGRDLMQIVRESGIMVGPVEIEQWLERLFPRERESSRALTRYAKQSALDDSHTWADGGPAAIAHSPTRSGLVPKLTLTGSQSYDATATGGQLDSCTPLSTPQQNLERLISQPFAPMPTRPAWQRGVLLGAIVAASAAVGVAWGVWGRGAEPEGRLAQVDVATPDAVIVHTPPAAPAAVAVQPPPAAMVQPAVAPAALAPEVAPAEAEHTKVVRLSGDGRAMRDGRRSKGAPDASRSVLAPSPSATIPEGREREAEGVPQAVPTAPSAPAASSPSVAGAETAAVPVASALRDAPTPVATPAPAPVAVAPPPAKVPAPKATGPLAAHASIGSLDVDGSLGSGIVTRMLSRAHPLFDKCYEEAATKAQKNDFASLSASLTIDEMGAVRAVETGSHPLPGYAHCVGEAFKRLRSDRKPDVGTVRVKLQVTLRGK